MKILIAEDQPTSALVLRRLLERLKHDVTVVTDGDEAWQVVEKIWFPVIISDWVMPGMDGLDLCKLIRQQTDRPYTYIILLTSKEGQDERLEGLRAGADDFVVKPPNAKELAVRLEIASRILAVQDELERRNRLLADLAHSDELTGVHNRRRFRELLEHNFREAMRSKQPLSLLMIDVDQFKSFNDEFGHPNGDAVLQKVAALLKKGVQKVGEVSRYGGEEFAILLPNISGEDATSIANRLRMFLVRTTWSLRPITASFGVATTNLGSIRPDILVREADQRFTDPSERGGTGSLIFEILMSMPSTPPIPHELHPLNFTELRLTASQGNFNVPVGSHPNLSQTEIWHDGLWRNLAMFAMDRGRKVAQTLVASTFIGVFASQTAPAQLSDYFHKKASPLPGAKPSAPPTATEQPRLEVVRVPTNSSDPIAIVNGEVITRQQLADECVARKGQEILDTLIARRLIEQEMKKKKAEITPLEIDAEIDRVAMGVGHVSREVWLRTLDKERGISPATYARDIIYPSLALRKLAEKKVQVTEQDMKDAFEANFGPRLRCRIIMTNDIRKAGEIWEEVRKNPGGFDKLAQEKSLDSATRSFGGLLPDPIARHAVPREVSDAAFRQLVDGDPADKNPAHKPKDGDFTGPIQVNEGAWVIIKREALAPGRSGSLNDPAVKNMLEGQMVDVKLKDAMNTIYNDLMAASDIDNKLTGQVKQGHEENQPEFQAARQKDRELMNVAGETKPTTLPMSTRDVPASSTSAMGASNRPPAGAPPASSAFQSTGKSAPR